jgi:hypothetical protein
MLVNAYFNCVCLRRGACWAGMIRMQMEDDAPLNLRSFNLPTLYTTVAFNLEYAYRWK